jgi:hypothetical protein
MIELSSLVSVLCCCVSSCIAVCSMQTFIGQFGRGDAPLTMEQRITGFFPMLVSMIGAIFKLE